MCIQKMFDLGLEVFIIRVTCSTSMKGLYIHIHIDIDLHLLCLIYIYIYIRIDIREHAMLMLCYATLCYVVYTNLHIHIYI